MVIVYKTNLGKQRVWTLLDSCPQDENRTECLCGHGIETTYSKKKKKKNSGSLVCEVILFYFILNYYYITYIILFF
jgi:hypothetical protein